MNDGDATPAGEQQVTEIQGPVDDRMEVPSTIARRARAGLTFAGHTGLYVIAQRPLGEAAATIQPWLP